MFNSAINANEKSLTKNILGVLILSVVLAGLLVLLGAQSSTANAEVRKPYFRVYGGNVVTGDRCRSYGTTNLTELPRVISWNKTSDWGGSAGTHGVFALGLINEFASAAGRTTPPTPTKGLSFANDDGVGNYGGGLSDTHMPCLKSYFNVPSEGVNPISGGAFQVHTSESGVYFREGDLNLDGTGDYGTKKITIYVNGDVTISQNLINVLSGGGVSDLGNLPSLTIIARNIYIRPNVSEVAATLIAEASDPSEVTEGVIYTCNLPSTTTDEALTEHIRNVCNGQLQIYGSLIAQRLKLFRSPGDYESASNNERHDTGQAAERIIYSPEVWMPNASTSSVQLKDTYDAFTAMPPIL
jgi:hypothetical protein